MNEQETLDYARIAQAIGYIRENFKRQPGLDEIAREVALSTAHLRSGQGLVLRSSCNIPVLNMPRKFWMRLMRLCLIRHRKRDFPVRADCMICL